MAFLIVRVEPRENDTLPREQCAPIVGKWARRFPLREPTIREIVGRLSFLGFDRAPARGAEPDEWPLIAYVYVSKRKDGVGRSASTLHKGRTRSSRAIAP